MNPIQRNSEIYKSKRSEIHDLKELLNRKINLELLFKRKAIDLINASKDKKTIAQAQQTITELDNKLRLLKNELDSLNCSFLSYQKLTTDLPMIPIGLKHTEPLNVKEILIDKLKNHYKVDPELFTDFIEDFQNLRNSIVDPERTEFGLEKHKKYYSYLSAIDQRFFPVDIKQTNKHFEWKDSFSGISYKQRSPAFEKGCLLFNIGCLYSQIATNFNRTTIDGLEKSNRYFTKAAQVFVMLRNNFSHAPSDDMSKPVLTLLISIMMLQAQECVFLEFALNPKQENENFQRLAAYIGEAMSLSFRYEFCPHKSYSREYEVVPNSWSGMCSIKSAYYKAQAYYRLAAALLGLSMYGIEFNPDGTIEDSPKLAEYDKQVESELNLWMKEISHVVRFTVPLDEEESKKARKRSNFHSLSRKAGADVQNSTKRSHSSLSIRSWKGKGDSIKSQHSDVLARVEQEVKSPSNRFDSCQVGKACLVEAIRYMQEVLGIIRINDSLHDQAELVEFVKKIINNWTDQHNRLKSNQRALQLRYAPDYPLDDGRSLNELPMNLTEKTKGKIKKSTSNLSTNSIDTIGTKKGNRSIYGSTTSLAKAIHVAPRLLPTGSRDIEEPPSFILTDEINILEDPFEMIGPIEFFNAQRRWSSTKTIRMVKDPKAGYGFSIKGECPIKVINCDPDSPADRAGLKPDDVLIAINGVKVTNLAHREAVELVRKGLLEDGELKQDIVEMTVVTPVN